MSDKPDWQAFLRLAAQCDDHHVYAAAACEIAPLAVRRVLALEALVRDLRGKMFRPDFVLEREWETAEQEAQRIARNTDRRSKWDTETENILEALRGD